MAGPQRCAGTHQSEDLLRAYPRGFGAALTKNARGKVCTGFVYPFIPRKGAEADVFSYVRFLVSHLHLGQRRTYCMRPSFSFASLRPEDRRERAACRPEPVSGGRFVSDKYFKGDQWFRQKVVGRTKEELRRRSAQFAQEHSGASDEELLDYVRGEAEQLGCTPNAGEIIGGGFISARFDGWKNVVAAAGLAPPKRQKPITKRQIFKDEFKRQAKLFSRERSEAKEAARTEKRAKDAAAAAELRFREARDAEWARAHSGDTDEQLLAYVRRCASALGETPFERQVVGGTYIRARFGSWAVALYLAELPPRPGMKPANPATLKAYLQKRRAGRD